MAYLIGQSHQFSDYIKIVPLLCFLCRVGLSLQNSWTMVPMLSLKYPELLPHHLATDDVVVPLCKGHIYVHKHPDRYRYDCSDRLNTHANTHTQKQTSMYTHTLFIRMYAIHQLLVSKSNFYTFNQHMKRPPALTSSFRRLSSFLSCDHAIFLVSGSN